MDEKKKPNRWNLVWIFLLSVILIFGIWFGSKHQSQKTKDEDKETIDSAIEEEIFLEERPVEIDYSQEPEEILAQYTERGMNEFKVNFPDTLSMNYALKNIGKEPVEIAGKTIYGKEFSLAELKGKNVVLTFAKTTCTYCQEMTPILHKLAEKNPDVIFVTIFPVDNNTDIQSYYKKLELEIPELVLSLEDNEGLKDLAIKDYNITQVPTFVFVDDTGRISYTYIGSKDEIMFQDMINTAFGEEKLYEFVRTVTIRVDKDGNEIVEEELIKDNVIDEDGIDHTKSEVSKTKNQKDTVSETSSPDDPVSSESNH